MKQRILTALWGIPFLLAFIWFEIPRLHFPLFVVLAAVIAALGLLEFYGLARQLGGQPPAWLGVVLCVFFVVSPHFEARFDVDWVAPSVLGLAVVVPVAWTFFSSRGRFAFGWAWTVAGILYLGWTLSHYVALRELDQGREWVVLALFSTFACDAGAFLVGRVWGRLALAPSISPAKTWEGAVGGLLAAPAAALIIYALLEVAGAPLPASPVEIMGLGFLIGIFGQLGDLFESLIKRRAGVKDSGALLPGHGGVLDRLDSVVFTGVIVYYYVLWIAG